MQRESWTWTDTRLPEPARVARWGHFGTPVLLFPSAGGDYEEVERFHLVGALRELIDAGRIKVFSVDGVAARTWIRGTASPADCVGAQMRHEAFINEELLPLIRRDCHTDSLQIVAAGAAVGAHSAVSMLCHHPHTFRVAIALSGIFELAKFLPGGYTPELHESLPLHYLPTLPDGPHLQSLRHRFVQIATGEGEYEQPAESRQLASALTARGIPNQLDAWGRNYAHCWSTWRDMLPRFVAAHV